MAEKNWEISVKERRDFITRRVLKSIHLGHCYICEYGRKKSKNKKKTLN